VFFPFALGGIAIFCAHFSSRSRAFTLRTRERETTKKARAPTAEQILNQKIMVISKHCIKDQHTYELFIDGQKIFERLSLYVPESGFEVTYFG
jgi:hypothetical protein